MNFYLNLRNIINILDCTNIELSKACNLDSTIISKFKNNIRTPKKGSPVFESLINGICNIATKNNKVKMINDLCGNENNLYTNIYNYLVNNSNDIRLSKEDALIGANLKRIMNTFQISNAMIAKHLNKDSSLISKYKTEKRYILRNDNTVDNLCAYFENYIIKNNLQKDAYSLFNVSNPDNLKNVIFNYLFTIQKDNLQINTLLESINNFKLEFFDNIPSIEKIISNNTIVSKKQYYIGQDEFRDSIKRLLSNVCLNKTSTILYLYSDENMKWLLHDKEFYNVWKILMMNCLIKNNSIKIIHNINRNADEMFKAIESWLPLYMTGLIEPYYNLNNNYNFTHTLFIADQLSVISSSSVLCGKDCNVYNYSDNKYVINNYKLQFIELLSNSKPLVKTYVGKRIKEKLSYKDYYYEYKYKKLKNIIIMFKKDESEVLVFKNNFQKILFEFTCPKMIEVFKTYINNCIC